MFIYNVLLKDQDNILILRSFYDSNKANSYKDEVKELVKKEKKILSALCFDLELSSDVFASTLKQFRTSYSLEEQRIVQLSDYVDCSEVLVIRSELQ